MTQLRNRFGVFSGAVAILLAIQLVVFERGVFDGTRFVEPAGFAYAVGLVAAAAYLAAIAILIRRWRPSRALEVLVVGAVIAFTVRFHLPRLFLRYQAHQQAEHERINAGRAPRLAAEESPQLVSFLRELAAAQEQYRLGVATYTSSVDSLRPWTQPPVESSVRITALGDRGWTAVGSLAGVTCSIWVRDSSLRRDKLQTEGSPTCEKREDRTPSERISSIIAPPATATHHFNASDVSGTWVQHRADIHRTGVVTGSGIGYRWDARVGGPLRASVSIAGNQVFVGSHANGEVVALTLDSGKTGFRIRAPNWIHHELALDKELMIVGFGNNEPAPASGGYVGTDPSGVAAYDRRTGVERWRKYTKGSVMGTPALQDSIVVVSTSANETLGLRLRDGLQLWRTEVPGPSPMANLLLVDSLGVIGMEPVNVCALAVGSGSVKFCATMGTDGWGTGHASAAIFRDLVLQMYEATVTKAPTGPLEGLEYFAKMVAGLPKTTTRDQVLVALDLRDGHERWRTRIARGQTLDLGHIAGTPTVVNGVAYVPVKGSIVAVEAETGRILWSTASRVTRGTVTVIRGSVIAATRDTALVVLEAATGRQRCRQRLPAIADRAGPAISGETGVLSLSNGLLMARPVRDWLACRA